tara:strand:- start:593 stop:772 length:180 start_codon:yes stop_codon:yes gene_type:complete
MPDDLSTNVCPKCSKKSKEAINPIKKERVGWYCLSCCHFEEAILRERVWNPKISHNKKV